MSGTAFWILVWIFTVEHPNGDLTEHTQSYANRYSFAECLDQRDTFERIVWLKDLTPDGGDAISSRFVCVPVPE